MQKIREQTSCKRVFVWRDDTRMGQEWNKMWIKCKINLITVVLFRRYPALRIQHFGLLKFLSVYKLPPVAARATLPTRDEEEYDQRVRGKLQAYRSVYTEFCMSVPSLLTISTSPRQYLRKRRSPVPEEI